MKIEIHITPSEQENLIVLCKEALAVWKHVLSNMVVTEESISYGEDVVAEMGFVICEFGPDKDVCETCKEPMLQHYFQGSSGDGRYVCLHCILIEWMKNQQTISNIQALERKGHTYHCACRQVWGDGVCECGPAEIEITNEGIRRIKNIYQF